MLANHHQYRWAQEKIIAHHYLHQPVSPRSRMRRSTADGMQQEQQEIMF
jgi:hypothetical protein